jgi:hypothetical protein
MRVFEIRSEDDRLRGFEVENLWLSRRSVARIVQSIPGVRLIRANSSWFGRDDFCEFELNDVRFVAEEPFGDNSRYWIGSIEPNHDAEVRVVRDRFLTVVRPEWISARLVTGGMLIYFGQSWLRRPMAPLGAIALLAGCGLMISWALAFKRGVYRSRAVEEH